MATIDDIFETITEADVENSQEYLVVDPDSRQILIPEAEEVFGVEDDEQADRKYFLAPRYVGDDLDLASCYIRINFRNANGEEDSYLVQDVTVVGDNVIFSWELSHKVTAYKGKIQFLVYACLPGADGAKDTKWHTTLATGVSLEGLDPDDSGVEESTSDVIAQLLALVDQQSAAVRAAAAEATEEAKEAIRAQGAATLATIPGEYTELQQKVDETVRTKADAIVCFSEGEAVVLTDSAEDPLRGLKLYGKTTQDGTPSINAPVDLVSARAGVDVYGKNIFPLFEKGKSITVNGVTFTIDEDGMITLNGTASAVTWVEVMYAFKMGTNPQTERIVSLEKTAYCVFSKVEKGGSFTGSVSNTIQTDDAEIVLKDVHSKVFQSGGVCRGWITVSKDTVCDNYTFGLQIEIGDAATAYEPYKAPQLFQFPAPNGLHGVPVPSGGNYTDTSGQQWVCDEVDLEKGVCVQRCVKKVLNGSENWAFASPQKYFTVGLAGKLPGSDILCDSLRKTSSLTTTTPSWWSANTTNNLLALAGFANIATTADELKAYLAQHPITIIYRLETPVETPLTAEEIAAYKALHTNRPNTTILNDGGGHMRVEYNADLKTYIDRRLAELVSANS